MKYLLFFLFIFFFSFYGFSQNDNCTGATTLSVYTSCTNTHSTTIGATESSTGCTGYADDDVWFKFVATNSYHVITVTPDDNSFDPVLEMFSGTCTGLASLYCQDDGFDGDAETISALGLTVGSTYYVRVYDWYPGSGSGGFNICVTGSLSSAPANDEPCSAIPLPEVTSACDYLNFSNTGATASAGAPTPSNCTGGSAPMIGGWSSSSKDVWFKCVVPSSGMLVVSAKPHGVTLTDGVVAIYRGACNSLTQIECYDDYDWAYPTITSLQPMIIRKTGLTPGETIYIRFWGYGTGSGTFGICVSSPDNDNCYQPLEICDLNGYKGTTSGAYTIDKPGNMDGTYAGSWYQGATLYSSTGSGPFGWGHTVNDVQINNNSWIVFTAANYTAQLTITVSDCWKSPALGVQMQVFSGDNCASFDTVSNFSESSTTLTITARNLTLGNQYYLMIDGFAGDICNYSIQASGGVQFSSIQATSNQVCSNNNMVTLTGPADAVGGYYWMHNGATSQSVTVYPATTTTYTLWAFGACDDNQILQTTVTVNSAPTVGTASASVYNICQSANTTLSLTSYSGSIQWEKSSTGTSGWSNVTGATTSPYTTAALTATTYYRAKISSGVCTPVYSNVVTITVNPTSVGGTAATSTTICSGSQASLTLSGYTGSIQWQSSLNGSIWSNISSATSATYTTPTLTSTTYYRAVVTSGSCASANSNTVTITVNAASVAGTASGTTPVCYGATSALSLSGYTGTIQWQSSPNGTTWTNISGATSSSYTTPALTATTYYRAVVTSGVCSPAYSGTVTVTVSPQSVGGTASANPSSLCSGNTSVLSVSGFTGSIQWQQSPTGTGSWTNISGATSSSYTTPVLTTTTYYRAVLTSGSGCTASNSTTASVTVTAQSVGGTASVSPASVCYNTNTTVSLSGYSGSIQWQQSTNGTTWNDISGATSSSYTTANLTSTLYIRALVSNSGCTASYSNTITITVFPSLNPGTIASNQTICSGLTPTAITQTVSASGGTGSFSYQWQSSSDNINWFNISAATNTSYYPPALTSTIYYRLVVTSGSCGSANTNTVTITVNPNPIAEAGTNQNIFNGTSASLTGSASGGSGNYSYSWTPSALVNNPNSAATQTVNLSATTVFTLTVTDASTSCTGTDQVTIYIIGGPLSVIGTATNYTICRGSAVELHAVGSGGNPGSYTYNWTCNLSGFTSTSLNPVDYPNVSSIYTVSLFDGANTVTDTVTVTVLNLPTANAGMDASICNGASTLISGSGSTGVVPLSYSWSNGVGAGMNQTVSPSASTTYTLTVTDGNGCQQTDNVSVNVNLLPQQYSVGGGGAYCTGGNGTSVTLSGSQTGVNYQLQYNGSNYGSPVSGTGNILTWNNLTSAGSYTVIATNVATSCQNTMLSSASISINPLPNPVISGDIDVCAGEIVPYSAVNNNGHTYLWNITGGTPASSAGSSVDVTWGSVSPGILTLAETITATGCSSTTNSYAVVIHSLPNANAGQDDTMCYGGSIQISASASTGANPLSYSWDNNIGAGPTHSVSPNITTTYIVIVTDNYYCSASDHITITVLPLPVVDAGLNDTICQGQSAVLTASPISGTLPFTYAWDNGLAPDITHTVSPAASVFFHVTATDANSCMGIDSVWVIVNMLPSAIAGNDDTLCFGDTLDINASLSYGINPLIFAWNNGLPNSPTHTLVPTQTLEYILTLTDANACTATDTLKIIVNPLPVANAGLDAGVCLGDSVTISAATSTGTEPLNFIWNNNAGTNSEISILPYSSAYYAVTVSDINGCESSDSALVTVYTRPYAIAGEDVTVCKGDTIILDASLSSGNGTLSYIWNNGLGTGFTHQITADTAQIFYVSVKDVNNCIAVDSISVTVLSLPDYFVETVNTSCVGNADGQASVFLIVTETVTCLWHDGSTLPTISGLSAGNYYVVLTNQNTCSKTTAFEIKEGGDLQCLDIPSAFTPNGDGKNDKWEIRHINMYPNATLEIYSRWGQIIFSADKLYDQENWWDGTYNGKEASTGSYVYILKLNNGTDPITGVVTLIR